MRANSIRGASPLGLPTIRLRAERYGETSPKLEEGRRALSRDARSQRKKRQVDEMASSLVSVAFESWLYSDAS